MWARCRWPQTLEWNQRVSLKDDAGHFSITFKDTKSTGRGRQGGGIWKGVTGRGRWGGEQ